MRNVPLIYIRILIFLAFELPAFFALHFGPLSVSQCSFAPLINVMGCGASSYDANGVASPARLRPFFLHKLEVFALRRHPQAPLTSDPSSTHDNSKEVLLMHDSIEDGSASKHEPLFFDARKSTSEEAPDKEKVNKIEDIELTDGEFEDVEEEDYDERMLRNDGPGSPSFRVYIKDDGKDDNNYVTSDSFEDAVSSKESNDESLSNKKIVKKGRKARSFKKVLPKGGQIVVKNLLNVKSCYNSSNSAHHRTHFLTPRATA